MNVYDFDKTLYKNDSTLDFFKYCAKKRPAVLLVLPRFGVCALAYKLKLMTKTRMKQNFFRFLRRLPDVGAVVDAFWREHRAGLFDWYNEKRRPDDVIISASPEFLLKPVVERDWSAQLIASRVDEKTGVFTGLNCLGEQKLERFREQFGGRAEIDEFYSDSLSDGPLARMAKTAFLVDGETLLPWPEQNGERLSKPSRV